MLEGFDFGVGMLLPFLPRDERERGAMFETIGPVWDGNEVWLVVAGGATFAAFPAWYGTMFSGFYLALLLILFFLIVRVVSFEWREKSESPGWRRVWLWANTVGSIGIALIWGIGLSNLLHGVPIDSDGDYAGDFWDLFTGYTVLGGIAFVLLFAFHGATYPDAADDGRSLRTRAHGRARGWRSRPSRSSARLPDLDGRGRSRPQRQGRLPAGAAGRARDRSVRARPLVFVYAGRSGARVRAQRRRDAGPRRDALHLALPARDGLEPRLRQQPHRLGTPRRRTTRSPS